MLTPPAHHAPATAISRDYFLAAIAEVESRNNPNAIGPKGERSAYQITRRTWEQHDPRHPFGMFANNPAIALRVASEHYYWLIASLKQIGLDPSALNLATCWRLGLARGSRRIRSGATLPDSAQRVVNLYASLSP